MTWILSHIDESDAKLHAMEISQIGSRVGEWSDSIVEQAVKEVKNQYEWNNWDALIDLIKEFLPDPIRNELEK